MKTKNFVIIVKINNKLNMTLDSEDTKKIDPQMPITELLFQYPELAEVLTFEYGLYCVNCFIADFDTLEQGAKIHGIEEEDFIKMIKHLETIINSDNYD